MTEVWKDIPGYEGRFQASTLGQIRDLQEDGRVLHQYDNQNPPYYLVLLGQSNNRQYVHVLVALTFLGPRPARQQVRHLDCNSYNNALNNLAYGSRRENSVDPWRNGYKRKLSPEDVYAIRRRAAAGEVSESIAKDFGVSSSMVRRIKREEAFVWL